MVRLKNGFRLAQGSLTQTRREDVTTVFQDFCFLVIFVHEILISLHVQVYLGKYLGRPTKPYFAEEMLRFVVPSELSYTFGSSHTPHLTI